MTKTGNANGGDVNLWNASSSLGAVARETLAAGNNVNFQPSRRGDATSLDGSIRFLLADGQEVLRLSSDGLYVRGELVVDGDQPARAFLEWLDTVSQGTAT